MPGSPGGAGIARLRGLLAHRLLQSLPDIPPDRRAKAAADYLERAGYPTEPEQLRDHDCLVFRLPMHGRFSDWEFRRDGEIFNAEVRASLVSDDIDSLTAMAVAGGGITRLAEFIAEPLIRSGQLVELFRSTTKSHVYAEVEPIEFFLCISDRFQFTPKVKALFQYLQNSLPKKWANW